MKLTFYGAAKEVTGSNYLLEIEDSNKPNGVRKILVECGLHQGGRFCEKQNYEPFPYDAKEIDEVFVTHAHIDHTGLLPKLVKDGFKGSVFSTKPTRSFAEILLADSEHLLNREAERAGKPPVYSKDDVSHLIDLWHGVDYHKPVEIGDEGHTIGSATFYDAGHILGSASIVIEAEGKKVLFSGDLGNNPSPLIETSEAPVAVDYCLIESTYGNRIHEDLPRRHELLEQNVEESIKTGGVLMIPAFAMERTQILLLELKEMLAQKDIPDVPIFIDSPLAIKLTAIYNRYREFFKKSLQEKYANTEYMFRFKGLRRTLLTEESKAINSVPNPKIIIAGSGMSHGGRIIHHEKRYLPDPKSNLLIFGYQVEGSLGRRLLDGAKKVRILGQDVQVKADIRAIGAYSAHADQNMLIDWASSLKGTVKKMFIVHGEEAPGRALKDRLKKELSITAELPDKGQTVVL